MGQRARYVVPSDPALVPILVDRLLAMARRAGHFDGPAAERVGVASAWRCWIQR